MAASEVIDVRLKNLDEDCKTFYERVFEGMTQSNRSTLAAEVIVIINDHIIAETSKMVATSALGGNVFRPGILNEG